MCVLIVGVQWREDLPLVVAANRDESYARAAAPPEPDMVEGMEVLRPRDLQKGGTWMGTNAAGLVVVITNRRDGDVDARRRSRGLLCRDILAQPDAAAVERTLETALGRERYNSFNLFYADPRQACLSAWNGDLETQQLGSGAHVLSNEHALGQLTIPELEAVQGMPGPLLRGTLLGILASHSRRDERGFRVCKHGDVYGTVSSSLIYRRLDGSTLLEHAPGPPCTTPFALHRLASGA